MKEEILKDIKESLSNPKKGINIMGCSESYYNPDYMVGKCFTEEELVLMDEKTLKDLIKLADFAADVFY